MKKKIVINVPMHNDKAKSKAMKIAVAVQGVTSVSIGAENDRLQVSGEAIDSVCLANSLRKKICFAHIVSLEDVKPASSAPSSPDASPPKPTPMQYCPPVYYESRDVPTPYVGTLEEWTVVHPAQIVAAVEQLCQ